MIKRCRANIFKMVSIHIFMDNFDVVMPDGNEQEFIDVALSVGYDELVFLVDNPKYVFPLKNCGIKIRTAYMLGSTNDLSKARQGFDLIFAVANREYFECKVDYIINSELSDRKDSFHYKSTTLNQVHAKLAKENKISVVFSFNLLLDEKLRRLTLGRMLQNAVLVKKYKLQHSTFSMARRPEEMRSREVRTALEKVLGL